MSIVGYAVGLAFAQMILNKIVKLGNEEISFDYYKIVTEMVNSSKMWLSGDKNKVPISQVQKYWNSDSVCLFNY